MRSEGARSDGSLNGIVTLRNVRAHAYVRGGATDKRGRRSKRGDDADERLH